MKKLNKEEPLLQLALPKRALKVKSGFFLGSGSYFIWKKKKKMKRFNRNKHYQMNNKWKYHTLNPWFALGTVNHGTRKCKSWEAD